MHNWWQNLYFLGEIFLKISISVGKNEESCNSKISAPLLHSWVNLKILILRWLTLATSWLLPHFKYLAFSSLLVDFVPQALVNFCPNGHNFCMNHSYYSAVMTFREAAGKWEITQFKLCIASQLWKCHNQVICIHAASSDGVFISTEVWNEIGVTSMEHDQEWHHRKLPAFCQTITHEHTKFLLITIFHLFLCSSPL